MTYIDPFIKDRFVSVIVRHGSLIGERHLLSSQHLKNDKSKHLGIRLGTGRRNGLTISKDEYMVECAPGSIITQPLVVSGSAVISGAIFIGKEADSLIEVTGTLVLNNCILTKENAPSSGSYIAVGTTGKLLVTSCLFTGAPSGGDVVSTLGGNATASGNINTTGRANGAGVVTLGEVT